VQPNSMNLPPDKVRLLRSYDNEKKWELICDQERFQVKNPPHTYIQKLRGFLDPAVTRKVSYDFRRRVQESTQMLRELEISLRTNHIGWVREFLNEENRGLDVLVEYLSFAQYAVTFDGEQSEAGGEFHHLMLFLCVCSSTLVTRSNTLPSRRTLKNSRLVCKKDDVHVCVMCLRAIMNYQVCSESMRFEKLMEHFKNEDDNIDFLVACMQFINIVVHSVEDMNFRVHLQYDFTKLNLDEHLERLKHTESDRLQVQIQAYLDNVFDVGTLLEDAETKTAALERVEELEENLSTMSERLLDVENEAMLKIVELEKQLMQTNKELDHVRVRAHANIQSSWRHKMLYSQIYLNCTSTLKYHKYTEILLGVWIKLPLSSSVPMPPPPPPVAPPLPGSGGSPTVIFNSGLPQWEHTFGPLTSISDNLLSLSLSLSLSLCCAAVKIKKPIQTKFRLPVLNWVALKPSQINGTVFNDIDDESILRDLDVEGFEELFKTKAQGPAVDLTLSRQKLPQKAPSKVSLLEANRSKNLAITLRKAGQGSEVICRAIHTFDLRTVRVDFVECLMRFLPTEAEVKLLRQYERDRKPLEALSDEDRFMMQFSRIERLNQRMTIMTFMGNFTDNVQMLTPQLHAMIAASVSIKSSQKLKKILEIILALGNYMNSSKRGAVYGFKLQSLDLLLETKSTDRTQTLLHYIANVVREKYPVVSLFYNELHYVDKAAAVSLENVLCDVKELQRGMELTWREFSVQHNSTLKDFISRHESRLSKLQEDARIAQDAFEDVVKFFGESSKTMPPSVFFPIFVRFIKAYRVSNPDSPQTSPPLESPSHRGKRQQQELLTELRRRQGKDSRHVYEGKDGAIEDIITALKTVPFTARSAKRSSRFFCDPAHSEEHY
uniref:Formin-like 2b n=1 Tax=Sparus aurata TaxID=8175 RepID=A0A671YWN1_SPAAU